VLVFCCHDGDYRDFHICMRVSTVFVSGYFLVVFCVIFLSRSVAIADDKFRKFCVYFGIFEHLSSLFHEVSLSGRCVCLREPVL